MSVPNNLPIHATVCKVTPSRIIISYRSVLDLAIQQQANVFNIANPSTIRLSSFLPMLPITVAEEKTTVIMMKIIH